MFIYYESIKSPDELDKETGLYIWNYKIIDSEFEEIVRVPGQVADVGILEAIIDTYEKRNLPITSNLIKAILHVSKMHGYDIGWTIRYYRQYFPKIANHIKDIDKYLILL